MQWPCRLQFSDVIPHRLLYKYVITFQKLCYFHIHDVNITQHGLHLSHWLTLSSTPTPPTRTSPTVFNHFNLADGGRQFSDKFVPICHRTCHQIPQDCNLQETLNLFKLVLQLQKYKNEQIVVLNHYGWNMRIVQTQQFWQWYNMFNLLSKISLCKGRTSSSSSCQSHYIPEAKTTLGWMAFSVRSQNSLSCVTRVLSWKMLMWISEIWKQEKQHMNCTTAMLSKSHTNIAHFSTPVVS
jgi:hypothetical protein